MSRKRVAFILGTRPEVIKLSPVVLLARASRIIECQVICTGQHREMVGQALRIFNLVPDADLGVMKPGQDLAELTARLLLGVDSYLQQSAPDIVIVQGDTTTALAAAHAAFYRGITIAHVEAGLRTWDRRAPFPEEVNRVFISTIADMHFAPTDWARNNLLREGVDESSIHVTGNTVVDALNMALKVIENAPPELPEVPNRVLKHLLPIVLVTGHRRESFGEGLGQICKALTELAATFPEVSFVYPVHLNPRVEATVFSVLKGIPNIHLTPPLDYLQLLFLMSLCDLIITDSGGIQEEAPSLGKIVLVTREVTERPEGVAAGVAVLVGSDSRRIVTEASRLLQHVEAGGGLREHTNPYGDGRAASRIVHLIEQL